MHQASVRLYAPSWCETVCTRWFEAVWQYAPGCCEGACTSSLHCVDRWIVLNCFCYRRSGDLLEAFGSCLFLLTWKIACLLKDVASLIDKVSVCLNITFACKTEMRHIVTKPTRWHVGPAKTQISLGIRTVWSIFTVHMKKAWVLSYPFECTAKTLIRLGVCLGWSESSLDPHAISVVLSWGGSY